MPPATVKTFLAPEAYERGIAVSSAAEANAVPVAEFTLAAIIMGAKRAFPLAHLFRTRRTHRTSADLDRQHWIGTHGLTVGVVGASRIGRRVIELLRVLDAEVLLYDPYVSAAEAELLGVTSTDLDTLMATSDVVTVHAPDTPATRHLLDARRIGLMRPGTLLVNTARGRLVDTEALTGHLVSGRLDAVLDVTDPEPLPGGHPLWDLPNVFITPHMAGAQGNEVGLLRRAGRGRTVPVRPRTALQPPGAPRGLGADRVNIPTSPGGLNSTALNENQGWAGCAVRVRPGRAVAARPSRTWRGSRACRPRPCHGCSTATTRWPRRPVSGSRRRCASWGTS